MAKTQAKRSYRTFMRHEQLESRVMLSAAPSDPDQLAITAYVSGLGHGQWRRDAAVDLGISGTEIQFSPIGTPSFMAGTIAWAAPGGGASQIGRYQEHLTPILMDVTGDMVPDFIGTQGVATFSFYTGRSQNVFVGSITTVNTSYIQGVTANGEMVVGSTGVITACSGVFRSMSGGFTSQSVVGLFPSFAMQTAVHFTITDCRLDPRYVLKMAGDIASAFADSYKSQLKGQLESLYSRGSSNAPNQVQPSFNQQSPVQNDADPVQQTARGRHAQLDTDIGTFGGNRIDRWASDLADCLLGVAC
jgi:hypothetical protein